MNRLCAWVTRNCTFQNALVAGLVLTLAAFLGVLFSEWIETKISGQLDIAKKSDILKFVGIAMGGILVALQALMSYKRAVALENTANAQADAANAQAEAANAQARANLHTEQGQRQERMKNAIEHLGHKSDSVRLGGAYELFHLAKDADPHEDHTAIRQTVLDILCAHIRQTTGDIAYRNEHDSKPSEEVQSMLTLLFVQNHCVFKGCQINLQESWLDGAHLCEARLSMANLVYAHLKEASLSDAHLQGSDLLDADLAGACLFRAGLQGANLNGSSLQASRLSYAKLQGSVIENTCLHGAVLSSAFLQGASFAFCGLQGANLAGASLQGAGMKDWNKLIPFAVRIRKSIGQIADLSTNVFSNGLTAGGSGFPCRRSLGE